MSTPLGPAVIYEDSDSIYVHNELVRVLQYAHEAILHNRRLTFGQALDIGKNTADVRVRPQDEKPLLRALFKLSVNPEVLGMKRTMLTERLLTTRWTRWSYRKWSSARRRKLFTFRSQCLGAHDIYAQRARDPRVARPRNAEKVPRARKRRFTCRSCEEALEEFRAVDNVPAHAHLCSGCWKASPDKAHYMRVAS